MTNTRGIENPGGPIELWLTQRNMTVTARTVYEDESTSEGDEVDSLSMRGAQREMTGWLISLGYKPAGRWVVAEQDAGEPVETWRRFAPPDKDKGETE